MKGQAIVAKKVGKGRKISEQWCKIYAKQHLHNIKLNINYYVSHRVDIAYPIRLSPTVQPVANFGNGLWVELNQ